jgi:hypothetical protein
VTSSQPWVQHVAALGAIIARPQVKLDSSSATVSIATSCGRTAGCPCRAAVGRVDQRRVGREQRREQHHVRQDEQPEAVGDDDALRLRPAVAEAGVFRAAVGQADGACFGCHVDWLSWWRCSMRMRRRSRAFRPDFVDRDDHAHARRARRTRRTREGADQAEDRQPPDVPDDGEAADRGEEGADHAGRRVERHFDRL